MANDPATAPEKLPIGKILKGLTIPQAAALLTACGSLIGAGYVLSNNAAQGDLNEMRVQLKTAENTINNIKEKEMSSTTEIQALQIRSEFFQRISQYYLAVERWNQKHDRNLLQGAWQWDGPCTVPVDDAEGIERSIEALSATVERIRDYKTKEGQGNIDVRGGTIEKGASVVVRFSQNGQEWPIPESLTGCANPCAAANNPDTIDPCATDNPCTPAHCYE